MNKATEITFQVASSTPPIIELDPSAMAWYIRFSSNKVARTLERSGRGMIVTVDLDRNNRVVGIESIGCDEIAISAVLKQAKVEAPAIDFSKTRYRSTPHWANAEMAAAV